MGSQEELAAARPVGGRGCCWIWEMLAIYVALVIFKVFLSKSTNLSDLGIPGQTLMLAFPCHVLS